MVHVASLRRSRGVEAEDGRVLALIKLQFHILTCRVNV
jgi:hypothetical protein